MTTLAVSLTLTVPAAAGGASSGATVGYSAVTGSAADMAIGIPGEPVRSRPCSAHKAVRFYSRRLAEHMTKMGAAARPKTQALHGCPRYLAGVLQRKARAWRLRYERWHAYHYDWRSWLPDKWQRVGACETGYGRRPGDWRWNSGTYQGAFGFYHGSWDAFVPHADRKAGPYPSEAYLATPRQQYEVALAIWRRYGFSGWGCRGA